MYNDDIIKIIYGGSMKKIMVLIFGLFLIIPAANSAVKTNAKTNTGYSIAYVNDFEGDCEIKRRGEDTGEALQDLYIPLYEGDSIVTETDSRVEVIFDDSTIIKVDPESSFVIKSLVRKNNNRTIIQLIRGRVMAIVKKLIEKEEFTVKTKMAMAAVKGTEFIVDASDDNKVGVYEGAVEVSGLDMDGNVLHKIVLNKDQETVITKKLRSPERADRLSRNFVKRYKEISDLRGKIEYMREMRRSGRAEKFKIDRRLKRIEGLRTMMHADPEKFRNLPEGQKALVNEIMKEEPYLEAKKAQVEKKEGRTARLKAYLHKKRQNGEENKQEEPTPEN
jgi:hypothetical protein